MTATLPSADRTDSAAAPACDRPATHRPTTCGCTSPGCGPTTTTPVPVIERGEGCYIWDSNGKRYLDALSGLFVVQAGHGREELAQAAAAQARKLAFFPIWSYAHPTAIELADRLAAAAPGDLNKVFFSSGGGEAVETAWKLAKQYFKLTGKPGKYKVISRAIAYHGTTQGALSITGVPPFKHAFEPLVPGSVRVPNTNFYRAPDLVAHDEKVFGRWAADQVEEAILMEGADSVAAVFVEPVQNAGGCFPPPPGYFERLREICDTHDVLLVSDEVICAYGRLGTMFGAQKFGYQPDIITSAKGLTSRIFTARRGDHLRPDLRAVQQGHHHVSARLHLRRAPGFLRRRAGEPGHLRVRGPAGERAAQRERLPLHARAAAGPADRRRRPR